MNIKKDEIQCPLCQANKTNFLEKYSIETEDYSLYHCLSCDVQFWYPIKTPGAEWYEKNETYLSWDGSIRWEHKQFLMDRTIIGGKLLDLGCADGGFIFECSKLGYEVHGVEFNKTLYEAGMNKYGVKIYNDDIYKFLKNHQKIFDVITFFEAMEHLTDPYKLISLVKDSLKSGGYIALCVPNRDRKLYYFGLEHLKCADLPPHHFTRWSIKSLTNFFEMNNIDIIKIYHKHIDIYDISHQLGHKIRLGFGRRKINKFKETSDKTLLNDTKKLYKIKSKVFDFISIPLYLFLMPLKIPSTPIYCLGKVR